MNKLSIVSLLIVLEVSGGSYVQGKTKWNTNYKEIPTIAANNNLLDFAIPIKGTITNEKGEPVARASIVVKGSSQGTSSGQDGGFTLDIAVGATLVISAVGFNTLEIVATDGLKAVLTASNRNLEEVVVIGYSTQRKVNNPSAAVEVKASKLNFQPNATFQSALAGRVAGLQISQPTGQPGAAINVQIRNNPSPAADRGVLYVIDGVPVNDSPGVPNGSGYYGNAALYKRFNK
ncbi:MAG: SusC/RagA family TonB-linked outer membrane protein [Sphingobacterium sp.]|jgi:hypothetical protein|nr:SusC/RagA family TonB-linked outer membrane protein [Sphingobacterium sp.]